MAAHDGEDLHDWETFNEQIEKLLLSMQKTDRAAFQSPGVSMGLRDSQARIACHEQRPLFASIPEHAAVRQNLSESAFDRAASTGADSICSTIASDDSKEDAAGLQYTHSEALTADLQPSVCRSTAHAVDQAPSYDSQPSDSGTSGEGLIQPAQRSRDMQPLDDDLPHSASATAHASALAQAGINNTEANDDFHKPAAEQALSRAQKAAMVSQHAAEHMPCKPAMIPQRAVGQTGTGTERNEPPKDSPYLLLLQQIDLHIATCQASLASIYPLEQCHDIAEPVTPTPAKPTQATAFNLAEVPTLHLMSGSPVQVWQILALLNMVRVPALTQSQLHMPCQLELMPSIQHRRPRQQFIDWQLIAHTIKRRHFDCGRLLYPLA